MNDCVVQSCKNPTNISILIQHLENPISLTDYCEKYEISNYILFQLLLQVFLPLGKLMDNFTHNDLHSGNVLLYKVPNNKYIELKYILEDGSEIKFKTKYIIKLIDYGRSFFKDTSGTESSQKFYNFIINNKSCLNELKNAGFNHIDEALDWIKNNTNKATGIEYINSAISDIGYSFFDDKITADDYYINSLIGNNAKDLWLMKVIVANKFYNVSGNTSFDTKFIKLIKDIYYKTDDGKDTYAGNAVNTADCPTQNICNVKMVADSLVKLYNESKDEFIAKNNEKFEGEEEEGKMTVYMDLTKEIDFQLNRLTFTRPLLTNAEEASEELEEPIKTPNEAVIESTRQFRPFEIGPSSKRTRRETNFGGKISKRKTKKKSKSRLQFKKKIKTRKYKKQYKK